MIDWNTMVMLFCTLLALFLFWKESKRTNRQKLGWRLAATGIVIISLACIAVPLHYTQTETNASTSEAVLLTEGFDADSVQALLRQQPGLPIFYLDKNIDHLTMFNARYVPGASVLVSQNKDIHTLHLFGYGLDADQLNSLRDFTLLPHLSALPSGIMYIHWPQRLPAGDKLIIQGQCNNYSASKTTLMVTHFGEVLDSVTVAPGAAQPFTLSFVPKALGRQTYSLSVVSGKDTVERETIPLLVTGTSGIKVLLLSSSPDFDSRFLKNNVSKLGYPVATRTLISKDKYAYDFLNIPRLPLERITSSVLNQFDMLVADAAALSMLSKAEIATLQYQVAQKAMGLIVKADSAATGFFATPFPLVKMPGDSQQQLTAFLLDSTGILPPLTNDNLLSIRSQPNTQPLVIDWQQRVYAGSALYGAGKIIFTSLTSTYKWSLAGNEEAYQKYWATLLNKAAPKSQPAEAWAIHPYLSFIHQPVQLLLETGSSNFPKGEVNGADVYLQQQVLLPFVWGGVYYPRQEGWQIATESDGMPFYWYSFGENDWQNVRHSQKIIATRQYIYESLHNEQNAKTEAIERSVEISKLYFYLAFLFSAAFLWFENKYLLSSI